MKEEDPPTEFEYFAAHDGLRLYYEWHKPDGPERAVLLIVHGYAEHCGRYRHVAKRLSSEGFAVMGFDYRGHGRSEGQRGHCGRFHEFLLDLERAYDLAQTEMPDHPIGFITHSHGGLMALRLMCQAGRLPDVKAAVLSSPFLALRRKIPLPLVLAAHVLSRIAPRTSVDYRLRPTMFTHDPYMIQLVEVDPLVHHAATARWFVEATTAQEELGREIGRLSIPSLWLVADADPIADPAVSRRLYEAAGGQKALRIYEGYYHEVFNELGRQQVLNDVVEWVSRIFPR